MRGVGSGTTAFVQSWDRDDRILKVTNLSGSFIEGGLFYSIGRIITLGNPKAKARINRVCEERVLKTIETAVVCAGAAATGTILLAASTSTITTSTVISGIAGASQVGSQDKKPKQVDNWLNVFNKNFGNATLDRVYIPSFDSSWNFYSSINH